MREPVPGRALRASLALLVALGGWAWDTGPSEARAGLRQTVSATFAAPALRADLLVLCTDGRCETLVLEGTTARTVTLAVRHAASARDPLPDVALVTGRPLPPSAAACAGSTGVAVLLERTAASERELVVELRVDDRVLASRTVLGTERQARRSASVCLPAA